MFEKIEADEKRGKDSLQWTDLIFEVRITYHIKMIHSAADLINT